MSDPAVRSIQKSTGQTGDQVLANDTAVEMLRKPGAAE
jgi:hypothetical protein